MGNPISIPHIDRILSSLDTLATSNCQPTDFYAAWFEQLVPLMNARFGFTVVRLPNERWTIQCRYGNGLLVETAERETLGESLTQLGKDASFSCEGKSKTYGGWSLNKMDPDANRVLIVWDRESPFDSRNESVLEGFLEIAQSYYHQSISNRMRQLLHDSQHATTLIRTAPNSQSRDGVWATAFQNLSQADRCVLLQCDPIGNCRCIAMSNAIDFSNGGIQLQYNKLLLEYRSGKNSAEQYEILKQYQKDHQLAAVQIVDLPRSEEQVVLEWSNRLEYENSVEGIHWVLPMISGLRDITHEIRRMSWFRRHGTLCSLLAILLGIMIVSVTSTEMYVHAEGILQPQRHQVLFVPIDGFVKEWHVHDGQQVETGDKLVDLQSPSLESHLQQIQHELRLSDEKKNGLNLLLAQLSTETSNEITVAAGRLAGEIQEIEQTKENLRERLKLALEERERLFLVSEIDGTVVMSSLELDRGVIPVKRGDSILRIVDTQGPWIVEANIEDDDIGILPPLEELQKLQLNIVRNSGTEPSFSGSVQHLASTLRPSNDRAVLVATLSTTLQQTMVRPGSSVSVRFPCGPARRGYIWTRPLIQSFQRRFWTF